MTNAALAYSGGYALFTLAGIASEDDLEHRISRHLRPPLSDPGEARQAGDRESRASVAPGKRNGNSIEAATRDATVAAPNPLSAEGSKELGAGMTAELEPLTTQDELDRWALLLAQGEHTSPG